MWSGTANAETEEGKQKSSRKLLHSVASFAASSISPANGSAHAPKHEPAQQAGMLIYRWGHRMYGSVCSALKSRCINVPDHVHSSPDMGAHHFLQQAGSDPDTSEDAGMQRPPSPACTVCRLTAANSWPCTSPFVFTWRGNYHMFWIWLTYLALLNDNNGLRTMQYT